MAASTMAIAPRVLRFKAKQRLFLKPEDSRMHDGVELFQKRRRVEDYRR